LIAAGFQNVVKTYRPGPLARPVAAVRGVTLTIPTGSVFGLLGPNRAGKTTLVKILLSLTRPTSGEVTRLGAPAADRRTLARVGYMHENQAFPRYLSAAEVLSFYGSLSGVPSESLPKRVDAMLERVGLADRRAEPISRFSKGMAQRLGLAQALVNDPELLVLDEPAEGLDLDGKGLLRQVVREFKAAGKTILMVSHAMADVEDLCDRAAVLVGGTVAYAGTVGELLHDPATGKRRDLEAALRPLYRKAVPA
jgi:ABC-2 type transport system ATP-binding protein